jgi:hypothetical protein
MMDNDLSMRELMPTEQAATQDGEGFAYSTTGLSRKKTKPLASYCKALVYQWETILH